MTSIQGHCQAIQFTTSTPAFPVVFLLLRQISSPLQNPGTQTAHILSLTMVELAEKLKEGSLSPESVLYSYMGKALEVNREVNCVIDFIHGCEDQLQKVKQQKEKGLLYGIPVSIKDHIDCKL